MTPAAARLRALELDFMRNNPHHHYYHRKHCYRLVDDGSGTKVRRAIADEIPGHYRAPQEPKPARRR